MDFPKPSKPAGCFFQVIGGILLIVGIAGMATVNHISVGNVFLSGIGLILLVWGGMPARVR